MTAALPQPKARLEAVARTATRAALPPLAEAEGSGKAPLIADVVVRGATRIADALTAALVGFALALLYVSEPGIVWTFRYFATLALTSLGLVVVFQLLGLYDRQMLSSILRQLPRLAAGWVITFAALGAAVFFLKEGQELSRLWMALWFAAGGAAIVATRLAVTARVKSWARQGRLYRRAVIFGAGEVTEDLIRQLEEEGDADIRIAGIFDDRNCPRASRTPSGYAQLGNLDDLITMSRNVRIDIVIVSLPLAREDRLSEIVKKLAVLPADIKLPARATKIRFSPRTYSHVGSVAMIDLYDKPITGWGTVSKWLFDKVIGTAALVLLAPVMAAVAIAIRLDSRGPVLFRQKRYGFNNELIEVLKFRSMHTDKCDAAAARLVTKDDPRVTRVGRFIRKTSLDELPQLFNVIKGDLSLVGPRPHAVQAKAGAQLYDEVVDGYFARHKVKPGITGWAQIHGWRGETDTEEKIQKRVEHDLYYIENWSVFLDLYILVKTPLSLLETKNAY